MSHELLVRGERISAIAFMSIKGILDCKAVLMGKPFVSSWKPLYFPT